VGSMQRDCCLGRECGSCFGRITHPFRYGRKGWGTRLCGWVGVTARRKVVV
jgi:hypothetical protein